mmetsp:Transcript_62219/g.184016  ORF Transcript_62219/g.184016 Transcript_62219/m.184016 type:complete len:108 (+) Transcript_62219:1894-2217(+)
MLLYTLGTKQRIMKTTITATAPEGKLNQTRIPAAPRSQAKLPRNRQAKLEAAWCFVTLEGPRTTAIVLADRSRQYSASSDQEEAVMKVLMPRASSSDQTRNGTSSVS